MTHLSHHSVRIQSPSGLDPELVSSTYKLSPELELEIKQGFYELK